jgi:CRP/FNR family transcriptional regulator, cyclic AMP receptor protein
MDEAKLAKVPLFAPLSKKERKRVAQIADEVDVPAGKQLVGEGTFAYEFFLIEDGTAEVRRGGQHVADLGPGDFFGEMGALANARRNATVTSSSPITAIVMTAQDFRHVAREMPAVAERIQQAVEEHSRAIAAPA